MLGPRQDLDPDDGPQQILGRPIGFGSPDSGRSRPGTTIGPSRRPGPTYGPAPGPNLATEDVPMPSVRTLALVLRTWDVFETSSVALLMTRELGKVSGLAKGARRLKSPMQGGLDLLGVSDIVLLHKGTDALDLIIEASPVERFDPLRRDLASPVCRLLHRRAAVGADRLPRPPPRALRRGHGDAPAPGRSRAAARAGVPVRAGLPPRAGPDARPRRLRPLRAWRLKLGARHSPSAWRPAASSAPIAAPASPTSRRSRGSSLAAIRILASPGSAWKGLDLPPSARVPIRATLGAVLSHAIGRRPRLLPFLGV